ncbi:MAG: ABC transporter ATP-binding protein [Rhodospirillales bacterium]|nr:ABC transporter ATP-binding protein [Rhodospirillales bacterium]
MTPLLEVSGLSVSYGAVQALRGVGLKVNAGEIVSIIGGNGAGKTTLMRAISGLVPASGSIRYGGAELMRLPAHRRVAAGIAHVPEGRQVFPDQTVDENLRLGAYARRIGRSELEREIDRCFLLFPRLRERRQQLAGTMSGGEQQMLAMSRALLAAPRLLLLDEPSLGLAPLLVTELFGTIGRLRQDGLTVLLVEQMANKALALCDRAYVLETGQVNMTGTGAQLMASDQVREAYLGRRRA